MLSGCDTTTPCARWRLLKRRTRVARQKFHLMRATFSSNFFCARATRRAQTPDANLPSFHSRIYLLALRDSSAKGMANKSGQPCRPRTALLQHTHSPLGRNDERLRLGAATQLARNKSQRRGVL